MLHEEDGSFSRGFSLLDMSISLVSNRAELLTDDEYFLGAGGRLHSLLSNFHRLVGIDPVPYPDVVLTLADDPRATFEFAETGRGRYTITGPILERETACADKRSSIFGNMGLFSKLLVRELEFRGLYSMHSTSFYDRKEHRLYLVPGGSGSGKSTVLLKAICLGGIEVFGTEMTHFSFDRGRTIMRKGSLWQNCRMGNLVHDFPELLGRFGLRAPAGDPWHAYESVPLMDMQVREDALDQASLVIVMPRIEGERRTTSLRRVPAGSVTEALCQNLSDKVSPPTLVWGTCFVPSVDSPDRQTARMEAARTFLREAPVEACFSVLSSPQACLDGIFPMTKHDTCSNTQEDSDA